MRASSRVFELLLRALPREFRGEHRDEIAELLADYSTGRSAWSRWMVLGRAALDILWVAALLRIGSARRPVRDAGASAVTFPPKRPWLEPIAMDIHHAFRSLGRDARLASFAILILALGIGATSLVFSVARALLLRPLPFPDPDRLVWISNGDWRKGQELSDISVQVGHVQDLREHSRLLAGVAGYSLFDAAGDHTLTGTGEPERITRLRATGGFFELLGVRPELGRLFTADELAWGGPRVALLFHGFWERRFAADPTVIGRAVSVDGMPLTVVGILPSSFDFSGTFAPGTRVDYVEPFPLSPETNRTGNVLALVARLQGGASLEAAQVEATALASAPHPDRRNRFEPVLTPLHEHVSGGFRSAMLVLGGAVALLMLVLCANLSNLLLVRGVARQKEMAVRAALGAARIRLILQTFAESLVLALLGGAVGTLFAAAGTRALARMDSNVPMLGHVRLDGAVLAFALGVTVLAGLVFSVVPAIRVSASAPGDALRESSRGASTSRRHGRLRDGLVVSEVALACALLVGAGLLLRSFVRVLDVDLGFEPRNTIALRVDPSTTFPTASAQDVYYGEVLRRVRATPGVEVAGATDVLPMAFNRAWSVRVPDTGESTDQGFRGSPYVRIVSEGYLGAMGLSLIAGRDFTDTDDRGGRPVIIINETLARSAWPGQDPIGRRLAPADGRNVEREVIGVVRGTRYLAPEQEPGQEMFLPLRQHADFSAVHVIVRGRLRPPELARVTGEAMRPLNPNLPVGDALVMEDVVARSLSPRRLLVTLLVAFAGFALALASAGIYGVISYSVRQRTREIAIRLALGASAREVRRRILSETLSLGAVGITVGLPGAWVLGRAMSGLLFEVGTTDPATFTAVPALLLAVAGAAGYLPAVRASRVDPMRALGGEG